MMNTIFGRKVGMTQVFNEDGRVVPVTVVDVANWFVTQIKTLDRDGYAALQVGLLKNKYRGDKFLTDWLKSKKLYFSLTKEVKLPAEEVVEFSIGQPIEVKTIGWENGDFLQVTGNAKGLGFQGVVKRWSFRGGPASHGSTFHRAPGSVGHMTSQGKIIKGKKLPGRCGGKQVTTKGLRLVSAVLDDGFIFVKGAVPGKKNSILTIKRQKK